MRPGEGRECTLPACLAGATGTDYDEVMGPSGAAFTTTIDPSAWDPIAASPLDEQTLARAARAAGVRVDKVTPPFDDEMRELVLDRIVESVEAGLPPLIRGAVGPSEFGLIVGYEIKEGDLSKATVLLRTYFDHGEEPTRAAWEVFAGEGRGEPYFLDRAERPPREQLAREALALALETADATRGALTAWLEGLRDESRWTDARHGGSAAFADHSMRAILADKRGSAARYLRAVRGFLPPRAGADVLRAAEEYGKVVEAAARAGVGPFDPGVAVRFVEGGHRRAWANLLEGVIAHEVAAHDALRSARAAFK